MLFCRREGKWNEAPDVDLFFDLLNNPDLQKECRHVPRDPMILALEKEDKKPLKRCCSACSIGKCCIKLSETEIL